MSPRRVSHLLGVALVAAMVLTGCGGSGHKHTSTSTSKAASPSASATTAAAASRSASGAAQLLRPGGQAHPIAVGNLTAAQKLEPQFVKAASRFGRLNLYSNLVCGYWPEKAHPPQLPVSAKGAPPKYLLTGTPPPNGTHCPAVTH